MKLKNPNAPAVKADAEKHWGVDALVAGETAYYRSRTSILGPTLSFFD